MKQRLGRRKAKGKLKNPRLSPVSLGIRCASLGPLGPMGWKAPKDVLIKGLGSGTSWLRIQRGPTIHFDVDLYLQIAK